MDLPPHLSAAFNLTRPDVQVALSVWHDEARGISRHQEPPGETIDVDGTDSDEGEGQAGPSNIAEQGSEPPTRPPSSASERASGPDEDFDMEGVNIAKSTGVQEGGDEFDFEVEMWDDTPFTNGPTSTPTNPPGPATKPSAPSLNQDDDQDMWDLVDELQARAKRNGGDDLPPKGAPAPADDDDWDSMYA